MPKHSKLMHNYGRLSLRSDGRIVQYHPQAVLRAAREQGYIVARVEPWCLASFGRLFELAPQMLEVCETLASDCTAAQVNDALAQIRRILSSLELALEVANRERTP